jgi:hypothetical protein
MTTLTIPADVVGILRNALHTEIGQDTSEIQSVSEAGHGDLHAEEYDEPLRHFDAHRELLDEIGRAKPDSDEPIQIDLAHHQWALLATLQSRLEVERDLMQVEPHLKGAEGQRQRATRYARTIEGFLPVVRAGVEQIEGE